MKRKYPINKEFFPFNKLTAPNNRFAITMARLFMHVPRFFLKDKEININKITIDGYKDEKFDIYVLNKKEIKENAPCIIYFHGGGFIFEATKSHYQLALKYAKDCDCKVIYVRYNLAPKYPFPYQQEEAFCALKYVYEHANELKIDKARIGLAGDSAGATLAVTSVLLSHRYGYNIDPLFHLLSYPRLDGRGVSDSNLRYTDVPMRNSKLSKKAHKYTDPNNIGFEAIYISPVEIDDLNFMPPAYIEVAEFDSLHDDGIIYSKRLKEFKIETELHEVKGTMHGYETKFNAPTTQKMISKRIEFINKMFAKDNDF